MNAVFGLRDSVELAGVDQRLFMQSLERGMDVLRSFQGGRDVLTLAEISERTDIGRSAVQRIVYTFEHLGYLERDPVGRGVRVTARVIELFDGLVSDDGAGPRIQALLRKLAEETGESSAWVGSDTDHIVILQSARSRNFSHVSLPVGQRFAMVSAASGQVFLAHMRLADAEAAYARAPAGAKARLGPKDFAGYSRHLENVKYLGYALTEKSEDLYSVSMSVPVLGGSGQVIGAINVSALQSRLPRRDAVPRLLGPMLRTADEMKALVGG